jgi:hypothetical protein
MSADPRLADLTVLLLAAKRCQARQQVPSWQHAEGISSLLAAAKALPQRGPWELPDLEAAGSMGRLLAEARQWEKEHPHGA